MVSRGGRSRTNPFRANDATNLHVSASSMCLGSGAAVSSKSTISFTVIPFGVHLISSQTPEASNNRSQYMSLSKSSNSNPSGVLVNRMFRETTQRVLSVMFIIASVCVTERRDCVLFRSVLFPKKTRSLLSEVQESQSLKDRFPPEAIFRRQCRWS